MTSLPAAAAVIAVIVTALMLGRTREISDRARRLRRRGGGQ